MASKQFIFQGFTAKTHKDTVNDLFKVKDIQRVLVSVAFVNDNGVDQLIQKLTEHGAKLSVFAGIRNDITTFQAMTRLQAINGSKVYAVDTGARHIVFHPKIYMVKGKTHARLSIGSANLTLGGLANNIEAGMLIEFDLSDDNDREVVDDIEAQFDALPKTYAENITLIKNAAKLKELMDLGRLVDENEALPPRPSKSGGKTGSTGDKVPRIKLASAYIPPKVKKASKPKTAATPAAGAAAPVPAPKTSSSVALELVWQSKPLVGRDLSSPNKGEAKSAKSKTNATGSINLDKGLLSGEIDHRSYFRDEVFPALTWTPKSKTVDETFGNFQLVIKNLDYGVHTLRVAHTHDQSLVTWKQRNATTRLSWGTAAAFLKDNDSLIGRTMSLYRDVADPTRFVIEID